MELVVDRIEEGIAVCEALESGEALRFASGELPDGTREGDVLVYEDGQLHMDTAATVRRKEQISRMLDELFG